MKRKLLFAIVALLCSVGTWATDYTSSLPALGTNWDFTASGPWQGDENKTIEDPKGQCADMSNYKFAEVYYNQASGTAFEVYKTLEVPNGTYIFQMAAFGRFANMGETGTTDINGEIFANGATAAVTSGEFVYYTVTTTVTDGTLKVGLRAKSGNRPNWWGYTDYTLVKVDDESDVDLTKLLVNSSFECNSTIGWTLGGNSSDTGVKTSTDPYTTTGIDGTYLFNTWSQGVPITQTIANMPNGDYTLTASLASSNDDADGKLYLLAQDGHSDVITIAKGTKGTFNNYNHAFSVTNNSVTVGVVGGNDDGTYTENGHWWYKADNFRLKFTARVNSFPETFTSGSSVSANIWYAYTVPANGWYTITPNAAGTYTYTQDGTQTVDAVFPRFYAPTTGKFQYLTAGTFYFKTNTAATVTIAATEISAGDDVTGYINDPSFEHVALNNDSPTSTDLLDWEGTRGAQEAFISYKINTRIYSGVDGNNLYNTWGGTPENGYYLKQILHNQPSGFYKLTCSVASDANASVRVAFGGAYSDVACGEDKTVGHEANVLLYNESAGDVLISLTCANWFKADNFTLTYIGTSPREVLHDAIEDASAYTLGFEDGEYAPYNNVAGITALAAAETTYENGSATIGELYDATTVLNGATWTANVGEVNAIAYGDLSSYETVGGKDYPWGWSKLDDGSRIMGGSEGTNNAGLSASSTGKAMLVKYNANYGRNEDYLMPLKANTYYTLSFKYCGWNNTPETRVVIKDSESQALTFTPSSFTPATSDGHSNAANWYEYKATFKTNDAGNYSIELNKVQDGQQQIAWADMNLVRATVSEIKPLLNSEIVAANATYNSGANVGEGVFQIPASAGAAFNTAINTTAQGVYDNPSATIDEVVTAIENLKAAEEAYANAELNAPADGARYYLKVATSGHEKENNAIVVSLGNVTNNNPTGYGFAAAAAPVAYMAQAFIFTKVSGNTYNISVERPEGFVYLTYGSLNGSAAGWKTQQIQGTTNAENKGEFQIVATSTANVFNIVNTVYEGTDNYIDCQDGGALYTDTNIDKKDFSLAEASQASVAINLDAGKYATRIFPFAPGAIDGIKFYSCENVEGERAQIDEVVTPEANKPYILKATKDVETELSGWGTAVADSYTQGWLTGVYTATTIAASVEPTAENDGAYRYVLQTQGAVQAFYKVNAEFTATAYRAYLTVPVEKTGGVKALFLDFGDATGINTIANSQQPMANGPIYNLAGQKMSKLQKGVNIVNGKKVLVK